MRLYRLVVEHGQALEADLKRYYGTELGDLATGRLSWRKLRNYVVALPRDSATVRASLGVDANWGLAEHLLAVLADATRAGNWQRGGGRGAKPKPIERPGARDSSTRYGRTKADPATVKAYLSQFLPRLDVDEDGTSGD